jgi:hypothetical protein
MAGPSIMAKTSVTYAVRLEIKVSAQRILKSKAMKEEIKDNEVIAPNFYCSDYSGATRVKNCTEQCENCALIVSVTRAKKRENSDVTWVKQ